MNHRVLYFSDCHIYGGSDRNIINIANHMAEQPDTQVFFAYRYFETYQSGVDRDLSTNAQAVPLSLLSNSTLFHRLNLIAAPTLIKKMIKLPFWLFQAVGLYTPYNYLVLRNTIRQIKPDIIHVNNGGYPASFICQIAVFAAKYCGIDKILYHINNPAQQQGSFLDKHIDRKINQYVDYFITASRQALETLEKRRLFDNQKLVQVFNTIETPAIIKSREEICTIHGIDKEKFILCEVAFLSERKGQIHILEALRKIREIHPDIYSRLVLFLVGDGEDHQKLKHYCEMNVLSNVIFTGYQANYIDYIACSDIFLLPSTGSEDMPLVILSAMSLGKPIIASDIAGIAEEIEHLKSGVLLTVEGLNNLHLEIIELFRNSNSRFSYGKNAKERFDGKFSQSIVYAKIKSLYASLGLYNKPETGMK